MPKTTPRTAVGRPQDARQRPSDPVQPRTHADAATARARAVRDAAASEMPGGEPYHAVTSTGPVVIHSIRFVPQDGDAPGYIEVFVGRPEGGDPRFRIFNPPTLVPDPAGDVTREEPGPGSRTRTVRYRVDPLAAVAEAIAVNGGRAKTGRRRGR